MKPLPGPRSLASITFILVAAFALAQAPPGGGGRGRGSAQPLDQVSVSRGRDLFAGNCAGCHGTDARGGRGPDLAHSLLLGSLGPFLGVGRPDAGMPAFTNLTNAEVTDIDSFIRSNVQSGRGSVNPGVIVVGDASAGKAFFEGDGKCSTCHSVSGDLKGIGTRHPANMVQNRIVMPRGDGGYPSRARGAVYTDYPQTATATLPSGQAVAGTLTNISDDYVVLIDSAGVRHTIARTDQAKVRIIDPLQAHVDMMRKITDKQIHDLTAYLVNIK